MQISTSLSAYSNEKNKNIFNQMFSGDMGQNIKIIDALIRLKNFYFAQFYTYLTQPPPIKYLVPYYTKVESISIYVSWIVI